MKEIFDFKRFGKYFVSDMRSCAANYGYSLALICLMGVIIYVGTVTMGFLINASWGGPECGFRNSVFWLSMFVMAVTMPVKCYGSLTEKRAGSQWLMIPASKFEKFLSMILITAVVIPAVAFGVTLGLDALLCAVDQTCGDSLISSMKTANTIHDDSVQTINSIISLALSFLLGAIFFKSSKTVKTFLVLFAIGTVTMTVLFTILFNGVNVTELVENESLANEIVGNGPFGGDDFVPALCCIVSYVLLLTGIFFRIKTLKH